VNLKQAIIFGFSIERLGIEGGLLLGDGKSNIRRNMFPTGFEKKTPGYFPADAGRKRRRGMKGDIPGNDRYVRGLVFPDVRKRKDPGVRKKKEKTEQKQKKGEPFAGEGPPF
jgi:hypothetical protein